MPMNTPSLFANGPTQRRQRTPTVSVAERLASGGNLSIREVGDWASASRSRVYQEIALGRLCVVKAGGRTIVPAAAAHAWMATLRNAA
jgi:hypothetical protein